MPSAVVVVSADLKGVVKEWDLAKGTVAREFDAKPLYKYDPSFRADIGGIRAIAFNADGALLACGGITDVSNAFAGVGKPAVVIVDWATGKSRPLVRPKEEFQGVFVIANNKAEYRKVQTGITGTSFTPSSTKATAVTATP